MAKKILIALLILVVVASTVGFGVYSKYFKIDEEGYFFAEDGKITGIDPSKTGKAVILPKKAEGITIKEVDINYYDVTKVDATHASELTHLNLARNVLESVDVSSNLKLERFNCSDNNLQVLDIKKNVNLIDLYCDENELVDLDVSKNTKLKWLSCYGNKIKEIDISNNTELEEIRVSVGTKVIGNHNAEILYYQYNKERGMWEVAE